MNIHARKSYDTIDVVPMSSALGAEIRGVDLRTEMSDRQFGEIRQAFADHSVIVLRDQDLAPEHHIAFAQRWGTININRFFRAVDGHPQIAEVRKEPDQESNIGSSWHTDHSYDQVPAMGSVLYAREVPPLGGDTLFSSMYLAYESLSAGMKATLDGLKAWHSSRHTFGQAARSAESSQDGRIGNPDTATQDALHPVVITHPLSGRKALYVNSNFTLRFDGWTPEESAPLLDYLYQHGARPEFTLRLVWQAGTIAIWDNRATWHCALNDYHGHRRLMHRITIDGVPLS